MIENGNWDAIRTILFSPARSKKANKEFIITLVETFNSLDVWPPGDIAEYISKKYPNALINKKSQSSPLHKACKFGMSRDVVNILLAKNTLIAYEQDETGKTPLHCAVQHICRKEEKGGSPTLDLVRMLCQVAPNTLHIVDDFDETPIDIAFRYKEKTGRPIASFLYEFLRGELILCWTNEKENAERNEPAPICEEMEVVKVMPPLSMTIKMQDTESNRFHDSGNPSIPQVVSWTENMPRHVVLSSSYRTT